MALASVHDEMTADGETDGLDADGKTTGDAGELAAAGGLVSFELQAVPPANQNSQDSACCPPHPALPERVARRKDVVEAKVAVRKVPMSPPCSRTELRLGITVRRRSPSPLRA